MLPKSWGHTWPVRRPAPAAAPPSAGGSPAAAAGVAVRPAVGRTLGRAITYRNLREPAGTAAAVWGLLLL